MTTMIAIITFQLGSNNAKPKTTPKHSTHTKKMKRTNWTASEISLTVADYISATQAIAAGGKVNKSVTRRALLARLEPSRTEGSIELKRMNISAVMQQLGLPVWSGYLPLDNIQQGLVDEVKRQAYAVAAISA